VWPRSVQVTAPVAERWGFLTAEAKLHGMALPVIDGLLAATAMTHLSLMIRLVAQI
jgi:predicted nucleic acid-binding protein